MINPPIEFVKNRDLLREINLSKASYCYYLDKKYIYYDYITSDVTEITPELIERLRQEKASPARKKNAIPIETIDPESIIIRVMTFEHIPLKGKDEKSKKNSSPYKRCPFPPFKHYILTNEGMLKEVLRSHWVDGFDNGQFCITHGKISRHLSKMMVMMVNRYGDKANWRGYSYLDEMKGQALMQLSQVGLQFDESKSVNPFAYYTTTMKMCFTRILNLEKQSQQIRDELLCMAGSNPSNTRMVEHEMENRSKY